MEFINKKILNSTSSSVFIVLAFLVALNFLVSQKPVYFDLTEEKIYTTSEATKNILKNLDKDVNVNLYISKDLPVDLLNVKTQLVDFMNQYQDFGGSRLKISYKEPENTKEEITKLAQKGIPQIQFNVIEKDKYEVKRGFFAAEIYSGEGDNLKREVIPMIQSVDNLEYNFISAVYSVSKEKKETVAFLSGHGEKNLETGDLAKSYNIEKVKIETEGDKKGFYKIKAGAQSGEEKDKSFITPVTLIIAGPTVEISEKEISVMGDFVKNGGNVMVLSEMVKPDLAGNLKAQVVKNGLNGFTKKYGIEINSDLTYDQSNSNINYRQGFFTVSRPYPFWVKALKDNFENDSALSQIQSLIFPWVSSLSLSDTDDYVASALINSTNQAGTMSENYNLLPDASPDFSSTSRKIIAAVSRPKDENSKSGIVLVIGDSDFVSSGFAEQIPDNETFFSNLVDSISSSAGLSSIRSKNITSRPIKDIPESEKNYWKFVSVFGAAALADVYGIFRIMRRRKKNINK